VIALLVVTLGFAAGPSATVSKTSPFALSCSASMS